MFAALSCQSQTSDSMLFLINNIKITAVFLAVDLFLTKFFLMRSVGWFKNKGLQCPIPKDRLGLI